MEPGQRSNGPPVQPQTPRWDFLRDLLPALFPDGALLACGQNSRVLVWETATRQEVHRLDEHEGGVFALVFTPDSRTLATGCWDAKVRLWELASGQKRWQFDGHRHRIYHLDLSPDGRALASGDSAGEVFLWDVTGLATERFRSSGPLSATKREELWRELQGNDAARAYQAIGVLAAAPRQAVPFLKERLRPATVGAAQVARLLADLDADDFAVREKATGTLAQLGKTVQPALQRALKDSASAEVRKRVADLLDRLAGASFPPEFLAGLRATEILEILGSAEARAVLQGLADGARALL